ncbi:perlucin-like protein [Penaeus japonicus]|uniref:perlucin-like protein n=1 Tax=Penaeus japonicus TaxID=27405 RepID=UPI001C716BF7|nr:perlucin-like protein [Penaeus japonicus]
MRLTFLFLTVAVCCASGATAACSPPFQAVGLKCLLVNNLAFGSWFDMKHYCSLLSSDLVQLDVATDFAALVEFIAEEGLTKAYYWIGASDEGKEGEWKWTASSNAVQMGAPFWAPTGSGCSAQEPKGGAQQNCAALNPNKHYYFDDLPCSNQAAVICEKK